MCFFIGSPLLQYGSYFIFWLIPYIGRGWIERFEIGLIGIPPGNIKSFTHCDSVAE